MFHYMTIFPNELSRDHKFADAWWLHQMETFLGLLALCAGNPPDTGEFPHKGQWRGALMFSLICDVRREDKI